MARPKRVRLGHFVFRKKSTGSIMLTLLFHERLLLACQQHRTVAYLNLKNDIQKVVPYIFLNTHHSLPN